jgi:hypothetical protein
MRTGAAPTGHLSRGEIFKRLAQTEGIDVPALLGRADLAMSISSRGLKIILKPNFRGKIFVIAAGEI